MARAPAPLWKRRKEPILDEHLRASVNQANGTPDPESGHYATLIYAGCETRERANEIKQALYRAGRYVGVSVSATVHRHDDGTYYVQFKAIDKTYAKRYMIQKYGPDRGRWPLRPATKER